MIDYNKVTAIEYFEKQREILDSLGRIDGVCKGVMCTECPLYSFGTGYSCYEFQFIEPLKAIKCIMDYEIPVDWSNVPVDTKVLVRNNTDDKWRKRHFAKYEDGRAYCWCDGNTSFTIDKNTVRHLSVGWEEVKLYKGEE